jgi:alkylation response protein AidB-like acyl-CoA dehydrogenase
MDFSYSAADEAFRAEVQGWLKAHVVGDYATVGHAHALGEGDTLEICKAWERELAAGGYIGLGWPKEYGGRALPITQQMIFHEEYVRAGAPHRISFFGEELLGPTLMAYGTEEQKRRFLPKILSMEEFWCQGFSEPDAGSDLANVKTTAVRDGDEWVVNGQKVWTSLGHIADWIFVVVRTDANAEKKHRGISYLLMPVDQPGIEMRPIVQITGNAEFNEVFFSDARTSADLIVGEENQGWRVVMGTLVFERGTAFLGEQLRWGTERDALLRYAKRRGLTADPLVRQELADVWMGLELVRLNGLRSFSKMIQGQALGPESSIGKLQWSAWHQKLGSLAMNLMGPAGLVGGDHETDEFSYIFQWSRAETIFAGSNEIQRNIIGERVLGLPREPA